MRQMDESVSDSVFVAERCGRLSFESAYGMLAATIRDLYKEHLYLLDSEAVNVYDRQEMRQIVEGRASVTEIKRSLVLLITAMRAHYGKPVIFLMDEYDVPLSKASSYGYYEQMLEVMKALMSTTLKDNPSLKFAVLTGCLKVAKESIFTEPIILSRIRFRIPASMNTLVYAKGCGPASGRSGTNGTESGDPGMV